MLSKQRANDFWYRSWRRNNNQLEGKVYSIEKITGITVWILKKERENITYIRNITTLMA